MQFRKRNGELTQGAKALIHLQQFSNNDDFNKSPKTHEDGIGKAINRSRAHASLVVKKLSDLGFIEGHLAHCGEKRRRVCYSLTSEGRKFLKENDF